MARDNSYNKGFPIDPTSEQAIGQGSMYTQDENGLIVPVSHNSMLPVSNPDIEVMEGHITKRRVVHKFGRNDAIGTVFTPVALGGVYRTPQAVNATKLRVKAGNAADTATGIGARKINIQGLNALGEQVSEELTTAGTSAGADSVNDYIRLYRAFVTESGVYATQSAGSHVGDLVIENAAGSEDWLTIAANGFPRGQSEVAAYTIPVGETGYIRSINLSVDSVKTATIILFQRPGILESVAPYQGMRTVSTYDGVSGALTIEPYSPLGPFAASTDIGMMGKFGTGTGSISVNFEILLVAD